MNAQRMDNLKCYLYLLSSFRNSPNMIRAFRGGTICSNAVLWNGVRLVHPADRRGMVGTILEVWREKCYTKNGFYTPQAGDQIVDAGAHVGLFSLAMAFANPQCHILALEPFPENYACLQQNILSAQAENIQSLPYAVGANETLAYIEPVGERSIDHLLRSSNSPERQPVHVVGLAEILNHLNTDHVAMLKMDIEGAEFDAFECANSNTLNCFERIAMEYHDNLRPGTLELLTKKLAPTHETRIEPTMDREYGVLFAKRRISK